MVAIAGAGFLGWQVWSLSQDNSDLRKQIASLSEASSSAQPIRSTTSATAVVIPESLKENMAAAISSGNTAALEGYMASSVRVIIAATSKNSTGTPTQAIADLEYLEAGTDPWNFNLSQATLSSFENGAYGSYFGDGTYVGQSANNYVVSFGINQAGKIATIFMAQNANLLN